MHTNKIYVSMRKQITMGDMQFNGTPEEWDALVKKNREITMAQDISKMETTQTAVEWFYQRILAKDIKEVYEQAKQMEKEQREQAKAEGYELAMSEAIKEIHKNYKPI